MDQPLLGRILQELQRALGAVQVPWERFWWAYLVSAFLLAGAAFMVRRPGASAARFLRRCFAPEVWWHPSARTDYLYYLCNRVLFALLFLPWVTSLTVAQGSWERALLVHAPGLRLDVDPGLHLSLLLTLWVAIGMDLGLFVAHWLQHRVPLLWEFHKVHHSAEVMTPITVARMHPLDDLLSMVCSGTFAGAAQALFLHALPGGPTGLRLYGVDAALFAFYLLGYNLRHSHVWIGWGPRLSHLLVSPAMHQCHHSVAERHWDKNMGFMFAWWDWLAGTLYVPAGREPLRFGLSATSGEEREYRGVLRLWFLPFLKLARAHRVALRAPVPAVTGALVLLVFLGGGHALRRSQAGVGGLPSLHLEELTWPEVRDALDEGLTTVIVPTGGVEQNGPHLALGKHNWIVRETAERVARELGDALVAPVVAYVPEGQVEPPDGHMRYPGTLSLPEPVFQQVLEATARSLRAHGFKLVCFLGDSYGNQPAQAGLAEHLDATWRPAVRVLHLSDYYARNGQVEWLHARGLAPAQIGGHAGVRDTSELMAIRPQAVRRGRIAAGGEFDETGVDGDPRLARAAWGEALLRLKVEAAVAQVRRFKAEAGQAPLTANLAR